MKYIHYNEKSNFVGCLQAGVIRKSIRGIDRVNSGRRSSNSPGVQKSAVVIMTFY